MVSTPEPHKKTYKEIEKLFRTTFERIVQSDPNKNVRITGRYGDGYIIVTREAPPAIISIFLGAELDKAFESIVSGEGDGITEDAVLGLGTPVLPPLPLDGGDRNRTSPFAFTGNKFEFRALGSSMSIAFTNTVLNTIVAEAIDDLSDELEAKLGEGIDLGAAVSEVVKRVPQREQGRLLRRRRLLRGVATPPRLSSAGSRT